MLGHRLDHDRLLEGVRSQDPDAVEAHRRVGNPVAEASSDVGHLVPVGPAGDRAHDVERGAVHEELDRVQEALVPDVPAAHPTGPDLPVGRGEQHTGGGDAGREVVQQGLELGGCRGGILLGSLRHSADFSAKHTLTGKARRERA